MPHGSIAPYCRSRWAGRIARPRDGLGGGRHPASQERRLGGHRAALCGSDAWAIADGNAKLFEDGRVKLDVEGLVLTPEGTNPVANGRVVVSCNGGGAGNVVQSGLVPLSIPDGNAAFRGTLPIPSPCLDPVVFFASPGGAWFAATD